ncbi:MAG TPA: hypothetical protein PKC28_12595 [Bdellovibrionales bacterium]|nr:hypothetical protein [Bdellovibrionales bacterium]
MSALLFTLILSSQPQNVCGVFQVEDFGDRRVYSLVQTDQKYQVQYAVQNPSTPVTDSLVRGLCYCVQGWVFEDPEFPGDAAYRVLQIEKVTDGPFSGCIPR